MFLIEEPGSSDIQGFRRDGFLVVERLIEPEAAARLAARFGPLFRGEFETGLYPDEWNWREGRDAEDLTRQICNAWKSDRQVARAVLHPRRDFLRQQFDQQFAHAAAVSRWPRERSQAPAEARASVLTRPI